MFSPPSLLMRPLVPPGPSLAVCPPGSTLGRAVVHLLFPRHRVDAPHETRVRPVPSFSTFASRSTDPRSSPALVPSLVSIACTRAPLSREYAAVFRSPQEKKRKSPEGASSRSGSRALEKRATRAATEIKVSLSFSTCEGRLCFTLYATR